MSQYVIMPTLQVTYLQELSNGELTLELHSPTQAFFVCGLTASGNDWNP